MSITYLNQLIAIREDLKNPMQHMVQAAYDSLYELWLEHNSDPDFTWSFEQVFENSLKVIQEFEDRRQKELSSEEDDENEVLDDVVEVNTQQFFVSHISDLNEDENMHPEKPQEEKDVIKKMKSYVPKIFISYAHKDEEFKDELVTMLAGLQRRGVIDAWQDRRIEAGDEWFEAIKKAMNECDMAVLLVSPDFIASEFIQIEELTHLFQRRIEDGVHVIPIIVRPCLWQSEPILKDLQALPKDGKPVIRFPVENGEREQIWVDIGKVIENTARRTAFGPSPTYIMTEEKKPSLRSDVFLVAKDIVLTNVTIVLERDRRRFSSEEQDHFIFALSRILKIDPNQIRILRVTDGSVVITLEMPEESAFLLLKLFLGNNDRLKALKLTKVDLHQSSDCFLDRSEKKNETQVSILFLAADPTDASRLRLGKEFAEIKEQLQQAKERDKFKLELPQLSVRPKDISGALLNTQPQIVHFSGHGTKEGALCFENEIGEVHLVQPNALASLFAQFKNQVNCVVLNACYSKIQAKAIAEHINYVIGMNKTRLSRF